MFLKALTDLHPLLQADKSYSITKRGEANHSMILRVTLSEDGKIQGIESLKEKNRGKSMLVPRTEETSDSGAGIYPQPGYSRNVEDTFGLPKTDKKTKRVDTERAKKAFQAWVEMHQTLTLSSENSETLSPLQNFLKDWGEIISESKQEIVLREHLGLGKEDKLPTGGGVVFLIGKIYAHDGHWAKELANTKEKSEGDIEDETPNQKVICVVTGQEDILAKTHPKIKIGNNALFSVNSPAFESYGNSAAVAGIGEDGAQKYGAALNALILHNEGKTHKAILGETTYVYWTFPSIMDAELETLFGPSDTGPKAQDTQALKETKSTFQHARAGRSTNNTAKVHILGLKPATGRTAVVFYKEIALQEFQTKIKEHEADIQIPGSKQKPKQIWQLRGALNVKKSKTQQAKDLTSSDINLFLASVLEGSNYPESLPLRALTELKVRNKLSEKKLLEKDKNHVSNQICFLQILAGWLCRNKKETKEETMNSNLYKLGQALRIAQDCQLKIHNPRGGDKERPNKGITERFGTLLCERPPAGFSQFIALHQTHLGKLRGMGLKEDATKFEEQMREALNATGSTGLPAKTSPSEQTQFWLGFYSKPKIG